MYTPHHYECMYTLHHMNVHHIIWTSTTYTPYDTSYEYCVQYHVQYHLGVWHRICNSHVLHVMSGVSRVRDRHCSALTASRSDQGRSESEHRARDNFSPVVASSSSAAIRWAATTNRIAALAERNCLFNFTGRAKDQVLAKWRKSVSMFGPMISFA